MAYNKQDIFEKGMAAIEKYKLFFIHDVVSYLPCTKSTFYDFFPINSEEMDAIKEALETERITLKISIRKKLFESNRETGLLALYKLLCTDEERQMLSMTEVKVTHGSDQPLFDLGLLSAEERQAWYKLYNKATGKIETIDISHEEINSNRNALGTGEG